MKYSFTDQTADHKSCSVSVRDAGSAADDVVHARLCKWRFIQLVVSPAAIADVVHDHVLAECVAVRHSQPTRLCHLLHRIVVRSFCYINGQNGKEHKTGERRPSTFSGDALPTIFPEKCFIQSHFLPWLYTEISVMIILCELHKYIILWYNF